MIRTVILVVVAVLATFVSPARADGPPPTKEQLDAAKQAFDEASVLYKAGKFGDAIEKLKESYRLSHNAILLYNIGHSYDQAGEKAKALFYLEQFLQKAPASAPMHADVVKRVDALKAEHVTPDAGAATEDEAAVTPAKPASKYPASAFQHRVIDSVPPGQPVDVAAVVPSDATLATTLFYRFSGEEQYASVRMERQGNQVAGRIAGDKVVGSTFYYYVEVRDAANTVVMRWGKSLSPNLVTIDAGANARGPGEPSSHGEEDPLRNPKPRADLEQHAQEESTHHGAATWISTGAAVALLGGAVASYIMAKHQSNVLRADASSCGTPPCRAFDATYDQDVESKGLRFNTIYQVSLGLGVATVAVAGYLWYRDSKAHKHDKVAVTPVTGSGFTGAIAAVPF